MAVIPQTASASAAGAPRWRRFLTPWRSPADQPAWARPALLAVAVVAAVAYGWGMAGASVEPFYGAAARSMSQSWHDFIFGAFDPAGTVTVDKLPGALWVQALSLRVFGFHIWALVLPQVAEGVLTILALYRAVRRLAGPAAGLTAAAVLAVTPVTVLLGRGNVSDSLLILLLVLAADATSAALVTGSLRQLLLAGVWVGLAFQAKMIQAWLALPALAAAYLLAAPAARLRTRCAHVALAGLVTVVVSLSWMTAVSLVPSQDRPYVDGSANDSVYTQVFDYNGLGRLTGNWATTAGPVSPLVIAATKSGQSLTAETLGIKPSWHRLLAGPFAADSGWLLPAAVVGAAGVLMSRRRRGRRDPLRAAVVLWGGWWLILAVFFSTGVFINAYYVAALVPAAAALCGGPFDTPFESAKTAHDSRALAADAPAVTRTVQRLERATPPGDALLGTDTSGAADIYILYSGREVLPIGGYLGNVPAPTLATLQADISRGYVRIFILPVSPAGPDPRVRWLESHCARQAPPPDARPVPSATFVCGLPAAHPVPAPPVPAPPSG
ncbi:glycosyltransferase family 39 protein [Trebonia sp.]|uniref:ArnT family glycosyltransferase n=1 Tax=Trebonia sp. TaxID=2767075 RepID=UPI002614E9C0|nr:glycosyltransferase family 39 protein [Trebonia sp.]